MADALAIRGGTPVRAEPWPLWPRSDERTAAAVTEVLTSTRWALSGPSDGRVAFERRFARDFADFNEVAHCTPVTSGTAALTIALQALGVGSGDEVIVPGLTWVACASAVLHLGARPVLADVDSATLTLDPAHAAEAITGRTRAIMAVHLANSVADLDAFTELSARTGIPFIEDCAQAHGARWRHRRVGGYGRAGCFSMQQSKLLTAGEGGAVVIFSIPEEAARAAVSDPTVMIGSALGVFAYVAGHAVFARYLGFPFIPGAGELAVICGARRTSTAGSAPRS